MKIHVILLAGGKGTRMNASVNKILLDLYNNSNILQYLKYHFLLDNN